MAYVDGDLEQEAQRNGYILEWTFDQDKMDFEYTIKKMTPEDHQRIQDGT